MSRDVEVAWTRNAGWVFRCHRCDISEFNLDERHAKARGERHVHGLAPMMSDTAEAAADSPRWRFDVPEVPDSVTAFKDGDDRVWLRLPGNQWALLTWGLEYISSCEKHAAEGHKAGYPLIDLLCHQPLVECEDPRGTA